jgi:hypothetical protein
MLRGIVSNLHLLMSAPFFASSPERRRAAGYHQDALREIKISQAAAEDSGF